MVTVTALRDEPGVRGIWGVLRTSVAVGELGVRRFDVRHDKLQPA